MSDCIFCKIKNKEIPSKIVYENDQIFVINDINPQAKHHLLVITKKHYENLNDVEDKDLLANILLAIKEVTKQEKIKEYKVQNNNGKSAGQEVPHLHFHVLSDQ